MLANRKLKRVSSSGMQHQKANAQYLQLLRVVDDPVVRACCDFFLSSSAIVAWDEVFSVRWRSTAVRAELGRGQVLCGWSSSVKGQYSFALLFFSLAFAVLLLGLHFLLLTLFGLRNTWPFRWRCCLFYNRILGKETRLSPDAILDPYCGSRYH